MLVQPDLIDEIYEAAAVPTLWPRVLDGLASEIGAFGVCFVHRGPQHAGWVTSERMETFAAEYIAEGWIERDGRVPPVIVEQFPGFRVDADYWTEQQVCDLPIYRDFLLPRGMKASAATALQGTRDDALHIGIEGLPSYATARRVVPMLDAVRPHLARAISLSVKLAQTQLEASVAALQLAGVPAAVISRGGRLFASNERFELRLGAHADTTRGRLSFKSRFAQEQLVRALAELGHSIGVRSIAVAPLADELPFALHLLPLQRSACAAFGTDGILVVLAEAANVSVPGADLLRLLFDLTPAEARVARSLVEGHTLKEAAAALRIAEATARVHLRSVFTKTGVSRQAELVRVMTGLGPPK